MRKEYKYPLGLKIIGFAWFFGVLSFDTALWWIFYKTDFDLAIGAFAATILLAIIGVGVLVWEGAI
jgi:hypothetical protein